MTTELQKFAAWVQALLAFFTVSAVVGLAYLLILIKVNLSDTLQALLNTAVGALIAWGGMSISFWVARHRQQDGSDETTLTTPTSIKTKES